MRVMSGVMNNFFFFLRQFSEKHIWKGKKKLIKRENTKT